jgi:hypothetical protein
METQLIEKISGHLMSEHLQGEQHTLEDRVIQLFKQARVADEAAKLPKERFDVVIDGIVALWKIDVMGRNVEEEDASKIRGSDRSPQHVNENVQKQVKNELDGIYHNFHGSNEWLPGSVKQLIDTALETDPKKMYSHKYGIMYGPDHYITRLEIAGDSYKSIISSAYPYVERVPMENYITKDRVESIFQMRKTFNTDLGSVVASLQPLPTEK